MRDLKNDQPSHNIDGYIIDSNSDEDEKGTLLDADLLNDQLGAMRAILSNAGIAVNGQQETVSNSQVLAALLAITQREAKAVGDQKLALSGGNVVGDLSVSGSLQASNYEIDGNNFKHSNQVLFSAANGAADYKALPTVNNKPMALQEYTNTKDQELQNQINTLSGLVEALTDKPGTIKAILNKNDMQSGWALCDGSSFSKSSNPILAQYFPSGKLPNMAGRGLFGVDTNESVARTYSGAVLKHDHSATSNITDNKPYNRVSGSNIPGETPHHSQTPLTGLYVTQTNLTRYFYHNSRQKPQEVSTTVNQSGANKNTTDRLTVYWIIKLG